MSEMITLSHGSGGKLTHKIIHEIFFREFSNEILLEKGDSAILHGGQGQLAFTTDSYVITPIEFKGGDIGKIAICGTVNDLAVSGAVPQYLTCSLIIEEGFEIAKLTQIIQSMAKTCREAGVKIVTGDTKVVPKGAADKIFINTAGIGQMIEGVHYKSSHIAPGDKVIITGTIGDHEASILVQRENFEMSVDLKSDCAPLNQMLNDITREFKRHIKIMRDATRGGVATTLNEFTEHNAMSIVLDEERLPIRSQVQGLSEMLGLDVLYMANEGKAILIVDEQQAPLVVKKLQEHPYGKDATIIGSVQEDERGKVYMKTVTGGHRMVDMLVGEQLPRIC